ncbi:DUF502 domain-containing protein [Natrialbaceae archaeon A-arb3/5]
MSELPATVKRWFINGVAITIPLVVTLIVLIVVLEFILNVLSPVVAAVAMLWPNNPPTAVIQATTLLSLVAAFLAVGFVAEYTPGQHISQVVHRTMETIPGVSTLYLSVRRASDILVDDDTDQFQEVKLVEFPHEKAYVLGFLTADTPELIADNAGVERMQTVMVPLGPNPTTNGFVLHMPHEKIHDVDLTVEEAVRSIATLGVATDGVGEE